MTPRVLLVEDSRSQALRMKLELSRHGLAVEIAVTGESGFDLACQQQPDVIILDINLPDLDGFSLCRKLKAHPNTAHIPVLMLTQRDEANDTLVGLEVGAEDYIPKDDFAEQNLLESLRHLRMI